MEQVSKEIRRETLRHWWLILTQSKLAIVFSIVILAALVWSVYKSSDSILTSEVIEGKVIGVHQIQGNTGSNVSMLAIQLRSSAKIMVLKPNNVPVKQGKMANVSKAISEQGSVYYYFLEYVDE